MKLFIITQLMQKGNNVVYGEIKTFGTLAYNLPSVQLNIQEVSYEQVTGNIKLMNLGDIIKLAKLEFVFQL